MNDESFGGDATRAKAGELTFQRMAELKGRLICGNPTEELTFRRMAELEGTPIRERDPAAYQSALGEWFDSIVDTPLKSFTVGDVARSIRQNLSLDYLIPYALQHLPSEPRTGYLYEGELLTALGSAPLEFWRMHDEYRKNFLGLIDLAIQSDDYEDLDADTIKRLRSMQKNLSL